MLLWAVGSYLFDIGVGVMAEIICVVSNHKIIAFDSEEFCVACIEDECNKYRLALTEIIERFENKQSLHKDDCFAYQVAKKALAST